MDAQLLRLHALLALFITTGVLHQTHVSVPLKIATILLLMHRTVPFHTDRAQPALISTIGVMMIIIVSRQLVIARL
jgi:hypothetical protein